jgi:hypothetical protein
VEEWPVLAGTPFERDVDTVVARPDGYWFFKGDQCAKTDIEGTGYVVRPKKITAEWTILEDL